MSVDREVAAFLRAKRNEGCRPLTIDSYRLVLRKFSEDHASVESLEAFTDPQVGTDLVFDFLDRHWSGAGEDTRVQRLVVLGSFFAWAFRAGRVSADPMQRIVRPRRKQGVAVRDRIPPKHFAVLVDAQHSDRDRAGLLLLGRLGLRREDLRLLELGDIDVDADELRLRNAKGGRRHVLPLVFEDVRDTLRSHLDGRGGHPDEFLLYPKSARTHPLSRAGIDLWFRRCLTHAGLSGYSMHQLRHAAIDDVRRATGNIDAARQLARHSNVSTTQTYLHASLDDLRKSLAGMPASHAA